MSMEYYGDYIEACSEAVMNYPGVDSNITLSVAMNQMSAADKAKTILWVIAETCEDGLATEQELIELLQRPVKGELG